MFTGLETPVTRGLRHLNHGWRFGLSAHPLLRGGVGDDHHDHAGIGARGCPRGLPPRRGRLRGERDQSPCDLQGLHTAFTVLPAVPLSLLPLLRYTQSDQRLAWIAAGVRGSVWT